MAEGACYTSVCVSVHIMKPAVPLVATLVLGCLSKYQVRFPVFVQYASQYLYWYKFTISPSSFLLIFPPYEPTGSLFKNDSMHHFTLRSFNVKATITIIPICCQYGSTVIKFNVLKLIFMFLSIMFKKNVLQRVTFSCIKTCYTCMSKF